MKLDDASWHYDADYPMDLPTVHAMTHMGLFLAWCIQRQLINDDLLTHSAKEVALIRQRKMTGSQFIMDVCDEKLELEDLNDLGQAFALAYYDNDTEFAQQHGGFFADYYDAMDCDALESLYHVEDNWDSYAILEPLLDAKLALFKRGFN